MSFGGVFASVAARLVNVTTAPFAFVLTVKSAANIFLPGLHLFAFSRHSRRVMISVRRSELNDSTQLGTSMQREGSSVSGVTSDTLARARQGEQAAFAALVREHQAMVFSVARNFLRDRAIAEEVAQEVFLHLYRHLAAIESPEHLKYWLRKVAGHRCIDYARRNQMQTVEWEEVSEPAAPAKTADVMLQQMLRRYVGTLPDMPRLIVTLRYQEDMEPTEIAEALEMPLNTVKSHLRRSLAILREKVGRSLGEKAI